MGIDTPSNEQTGALNNTSVIDDLVALRALIAKANGKFNMVNSSGNLVIMSIGDRPVLVSRDCWHDLIDSPSR